MAAMAGPPSNNLNVGFAHFGSAREVYDHLRQISLPGGEFVVRNFVCVIEVGSHPLPRVLPLAHLLAISSASLVETELFPRGALEYYTAKNMGWEFSQQQCDEWQVKPSHSFLTSPLASCWAADTFLRVFRRQSGQQV
ncbi:MAG: hypothetical protein SGPRY_003043 [Prymnesium sp.]